MTGSNRHGPVDTAGFMVQDGLPLVLCEWHAAAVENRERPLVVPAPEGGLRLGRLPQVVGEGAQDQRVGGQTGNVAGAHVVVNLHGVLGDSALSDEVMAVAVGREVVGRLDLSEKGVHPGTPDAAEQRKYLCSDIHIRDDVPLIYTGHCHESFRPG